METDTGFLKLYRYSLLLCDASLMLIYSFLIPGFALVGIPFLFFTYYIIVHLYTDQAHTAKRIYVVIRIALWGLFAILCYISKLMQDEGWNSFDGIFCLVSINNFFGSFILIPYAKDTEEEVGQLVGTSSNQMIVIIHTNQVPQMGSNNMINTPILHHQHGQPNPIHILQQTPFIQPLLRHH
eukprot:TRINITY_DN10813_c0_g1_i1.p1 TRINITY_DN10813_c0_g1~~TRINITY_DN10813_c0_g1_i1.p1  ORF type:complete len:182 (+),score=29.10 TRINITY_DN10813_c0_g1_i1:141-686(+)